MKAFFSISVASFFIFTFYSCKKDSNNNTPATVIIKYEIRTSDPLKDTSANNSVTIQYVNGTGQAVTASDFTAGMTVWTKTDTVKTTARPLNLSLSQSGPLFMTGPGNIFGSITIDGGIRSFYTESSINIGGNYRVSISPLSATVN